MIIIFLSQILVLIDYFEKIHFIYAWTKTLIKKSVHIIRFIYIVNVKIAMFQENVIISYAIVLQEQEQLNVTDNVKLEKNFHIKKNISKLQKCHIFSAKTRHIKLVCPAVLYVFNCDYHLVKCRIQHSTTMHKHLPLTAGVLIRYVKIIQTKLNIT